MCMWETPLYHLPSNQRSMRVVQAHRRLERIVWLFGKDEWWGSIGSERSSEPIKIFWGTDGIVVDCRGSLSFPLFGFWWRVFFTHVCRLDPVSKTCLRSARIGCTFDYDCLEISTCCPHRSRGSLRASRCVEDRTTMSPPSIKHLYWMPALFNVGHKCAKWNIDCCPEDSYMTL